MKKSCDNESDLFCMLRNVKAQVSMFIVVGVIVVAIIILFFFLRSQGGIGFIDQADKSPQGFLDTCLEPKLRETVNEISLHGGYVQPEFSRTFNENEIAYLCYNQNYYDTCVNQEPLYLEHLKQEIKQDIEDDVESCFQELRQSLQEQNYDVNLEQGDFSVELAPRIVGLEIQRKLNLQKGDERTNFESFRVLMPSRFYELAVVVQEIIFQEARFCNFEQQGFTLFYPEFDIKEFRTGDGDTIYTVKHKTTEEQIQFAVRGCVIPPGY